MKIVYTYIIGRGKTTDIIRESEVNMNTMNMSETARLILGLRAKGMSDTEITNLILFVETGEEQYKPKKESKEKKTSEYFAGCSDSSDTECRHRSGK